MASRKIEDLDPELQPKAREFVAECKEKGVDVLIYCTYRSDAEQDDLFALGRTKPGKIATKLPGGRSSHNKTINKKPAAKAFDAVAQKVIDGKKELLWNDAHSWEVMSSVAANIGLKWGGNYKTFKDKPHFYID